MAIYDIVAISTNSSGDPAQLYTTTTLTSTVGATRGQQLIGAAATLLGSAGWTTITSNTATYEAYGLQSPWFDDATVPSWYTENVPWVRLIATSNLTVTAVYGRYNGTTGTNTNTAAISGSQGGSGTVWHLVANPYQFALTGGNNVGFMMSALHVPDFVQERLQVKNCMFGVGGANPFTTSFVIISVNSWTLYEDRVSGSGVLSWSGNPANCLTTVQQIGGGARAVEPSTNYIWNPTDTAFQTSTIWWPLISPPTIAWEAGTAPPATTTNTPTAMGMLWDAMFLNRDYTRLSTFVGLPESPSAERRDWLVYGSSATEYRLNLLFNIGTS